MVTAELPAEPEPPNQLPVPPGVDTSAGDWRRADDACESLAGALRARELDTDFPHLRTAVNGFGRVVVHIGDVDPDVALRLADLLGRSGSRRRRARPGPGAA